MSQYVIRWLIACCVATSLTGCHNKLRVGTISGPETKLMKLVKAIALQEHGLSIKLVEFSDDQLLNTALNDGGLDANIFQFQAFLDEELEHTHYQLAPIAKTFAYPMGIYTHQVRHPRDIVKGAVVGIPSDPMNCTRALRLLEKANLIKLDIDSTAIVTTESIRYNPKLLTFKRLNTSKLVPALKKDVDIVVISSRDAIRFGLSPKKHAIFTEELKPDYANLIVVRQADQQSEDLRKLVAAYQDIAVVKYANTMFEGYAMPAWPGGESGIRTRGRL